VPLPGELDELDKASLASSAVCIPCHAPTPGERTPSASAASIWAGRVTLPGTPSGGDTRVHAPHDRVPGGCLGCHGGATKPVDHSFRVDAARCSSCHAAGPLKERADDHGDLVRARALALWSRLRDRMGLAPASGAGVSPAHASALTLDAGTSDALARALYEVSLVMEDPAAGVHNAPFARELLRDAEQILRGAGP
jgi:hypothetical protein